MKAKQAKLHYSFLLSDTNPYVENCLPYLRKTYKIFPGLHCHPYKWCEDGPVLSKSWWIRRHWYFNVVLVTAYACFVLGRAVQVKLDSESSLLQKFYMAFVTVMYSVAPVYHVTLVTTRDQFGPFWRSYIKFLQVAGNALDTRMATCAE